MKRPENQTCLYCCFYKQTRVEHGQCRRNPPTGIGDKFVGKWPEVADSYWCGGFHHGKGTPEKMAAQNIINPRQRSAPQPGQPQPRPVQPKLAPETGTGTGPLKLS